MTFDTIFISPMGYIAICMMLLVVHDATVLINKVNRVVIGKPLYTRNGPSQIICPT
jgi:hypothetical protein